MGHDRLNYLDIPPARRRNAAVKALTRLKDALGNPALTPEQVEAISTRIDHLNKWAAGTFEIPEEAQKGKKRAKAKAKAKGSKHLVTVTEKVPVEES